MKKCFLTNLLLTVAACALACGGDPGTHNWYMFSMYPHYGGSPAYEKQIENFWKEYEGVNAEYYYFYRSGMLEIAKKKGDQEMVTYLEKLNRYLDISDQVRETWSYPTEQQLAERRRTLTSLASSADTYRGTRLKAQYQLLAMRANMVMGRYDVNKTLWETRAKNMPASAWRDKMYNIYANALLHTGQRKQAWNIYAEQGDILSLRWSVRKFRDIAGIQSIVNEDPNAPVLRYLVQNFVNDAQETLDWGENADDEYMKETGNRVVVKQEVDRFFQLADRIISQQQSREPALWRAATAMLHHLQGDYNKAYAEADAAMKMAGTDRMHDNARCIRLLAAAAGAVDDNQLNSMLVNELAWLDQQKKAQVEDDCYYSNARDRILTQELHRRYKRNGQENMALAMIAMYDASPDRYYYEGGQNEDKVSPANWSTDLFWALDTMTVEQIESYVGFINKQPANDFERYVHNHIYRNPEYFYDIIGTRLLGQGRFTQAIPYLEKVSYGFIEKQNISWYMSHRDYTKPAWIVKQNGDDEDGPGNGHITTNKKLDFCHEIIQLQNLHPLQNGEERLKTAYRLATLYFQASHKGDCWFLGQYGSGTYPLDNDLDEGRADLTLNAINYLEQSSKSTDFNMQQESIYALAYIPTDSWAEYDWYNETLTPRPQSRQYAAYAKLDDFARKNGSRVAQYITKCDILKEFRKYR